jgi:sugar phosphate isomerase/epimerase
LETGILLAYRIGLKVEYVHLPYRQLNKRNTNDLWAFGAANKALIKSTIDLIKICDKHNVPVAILHQSHETGKYPNEIHCTKQGIKSLRKILSATKECKTKIAIENLNVSDNKYLEILLDAIDDPRFGLCYDSGHHYLYNPEFDIIGKYGNRIFAVHLQDNLMDAPDLDTTERDLHLLPFDGKIDFKKVMRDIARSSYSGPIMLESKFDRKKHGYFHYKGASPTEWLREAERRGQKLAKMLIENVK